MNVMQMITENSFVKIHLTNFRWHRAAPLQLLPFRIFSRGFWEVPGDAKSQHLHNQEGNLSRMLPLSHCLRIS